MIHKVITKKRYSLSGHAKTQELIVRCSSESEVMRALTGYKVDGEDSEDVSPSTLYGLFDPTRPNQAIELLSSAGVTDNVTVHTLH